MDSSKYSFKTLSNFRYGCSCDTKLKVCIKERGNHRTLEWTFCVADTNDWQCKIPDEAALQVANFYYIIFIIYLYHYFHHYFDTLHQKHTSGSEILCLRRRIFENLTFSNNFRQGAKIVKNFAVLSAKVLINELLKVVMVEHLYKPPQQIKHVKCIQTAEIFENLLSGYAHSGISRKELAQNWFHFLAQAQK